MGDSCIKIQNTGPLTREQLLCQNCMCNRI